MGDHKHDTCSRGHAIAGSNLGICTRNGKQTRFCRICKSAADSRRKKARRLYLRWGRFDDKELTLLYAIVVHCAKSNQLRVSTVESLSQFQREISKLMEERHQKDMPQLANQQGEQDAKEVNR